jgi:RHH-type rel operon transcriptional repressor/antitoxin RelB
MSTALSVRIPDHLASKLAQIASETERSKSFLIQKALESYLRDLADLQVAYDRLKDPLDSIVSAEDMREELGL